MKIAGPLKVSNVYFRQIIKQRFGTQIFFNFYFRIFNI